jgi:D-sedoheptulose 7-phosphate isomerase
MLGEPNMNRTVEDLIIRYPALKGIKPKIISAIDEIIVMYKNNGKLLLCGNGGSASDCEHIVGELMKDFLLKRPVSSEHLAAIEKAYPHDAEYLCKNLQEGLPAISLVSQTSLMTAFMNDVSADMVFAQQVFGYGKPGDVLVAISTSGNSKNVLNAVKVANALGINTIGLTNNSGGALKNLCKITITAPADETFKTQEYHLAIYHAICIAVEVAMFSGENSYGQL